MAVAKTAWCIICVIRIYVPRRQTECENMANILPIWDNSRDTVGKPLLPFFRLQSTLCPFGPTPFLYSCESWTSQALLTVIINVVLVITASQMDPPAYPLPRNFQECLLGFLHKPWSSLHAIINGSLQTLVFPKEPSLIWNSAVHVLMGLHISYVRTVVTNSILKASLSPHLPYYNLSSIKQPECCSKSCHITSLLCLKYSKSFPPHSEKDLIFHDSLPGWLCSSHTGLPVLWRYQAHVLLAPLHLLFPELGAPFCLIYFWPSLHATFKIATIFFIFLFCFTFLLNTYTIQSIVHLFIYLVLIFSY